MTLVSIKSTSTDPKRTADWLSQIQYGNQWGKLRLATGTYNITRGSANIPPTKSRSSPGFDLLRTEYQSAQNPSCDLSVSDICVPLINHLFSVLTIGVTRTRPLFIRFTVRAKGDSPNCFLVCIHSSLRIIQLSANGLVGWSCLPDMINPHYHLFIRLTAGQ